MTKYQMEAYKDSAHQYIEMALIVPLDAEDDDAAISSKLWQEFKELWLGMPDAAVLLVRLADGGCPEDVIDSAYELVTAQIISLFDSMVDQQKGHKDDQ